MQGNAFILPGQATSVCVCMRGTREESRFSFELDGWSRRASEVAVGGGAVVVGEAAAGGTEDSP